MMAADCLRQVGTDKEKLRLCLKNWHGHFSACRRRICISTTPTSLSFGVIVEVKGKGFAILKDAQ